VTLKLEDKKAIVAAVADIASRSVSVLAADYRGVTVSDMTRLRTQARQSGVQLRVVRNTLAKRAFEGTPFECMSEALVGSVILAFSQKELSAPARVIRDFIKSNDKLKVKALSVGGQLLGHDQLERVAKLPMRDEALAQLLSIMQAPIVKLLRTIQAPHAKLVRTVAAVRDQKQSA
jgi:large subunit ribosomal protein L10